MWNEGRNALGKGGGLITKDKTKRKRERGKQIQRKREKETERGTHGERESRRERLYDECCVCESVCVVGRVLER